MNRSNDDRNAATLLALFGLILCAGGLVFLTAMVMPAMLGFLLVMMGFVGMIAFHYFVWGRFLSRMHDRRDDHEDD